MDDERYWSEARKSCWTMGGEMLSVENYNTMVFIRSVLNSRQLGWNKKGVWLGARYRGGVWQWTTGKLGLWHFCCWKGSEMTSWFFLLRPWWCPWFSVSFSLCSGGNHCAQKVQYKIHSVSAQQSPSPLLSFVLKIIPVLNWLSKGYSQQWRVEHQLSLFSTSLSFRQLVQ